MTLKTKIPLYTSLILVISIFLVSLISLISFGSYVNQSIKTYRKELIDLTIRHLRDIVNIAYRMIDNSYRTYVKYTEDYGYIPIGKLDTLKIIVKEQEDWDKVVKMNMLKITISQLRNMRYGKDGYLWINEYDPPYKVIMHGGNPKLEGKSWIFTIPGTDINVYQAFHDTIAAYGGEGRVTYWFYKPGSAKRYPKISWVKLYQPLNWVIGTGVYVDEIDAIVNKKTQQLKIHMRQLVMTYIVITVILVLIATAIIYLFARSITRPIEQVTLALNELSKGKLFEVEKTNTKDEIGLMTESMARLIEGFKRYINFAREIGKGNLEVEFTPLSNEDMLGNELLKMREHLKQAREKELKQLEIEKRRHWLATGISMFTDLITANANDPEKMSQEVLKKLSEYVGFEVGGIFLLKFHEDDPNKRPYLQATATIAYNRPKYYQKTLEINEGLVGACFCERQPIYITDVPENYIQLKTGLGGTLPTNIYLAPITYENKAIGVIEVAAIRVFDEFDKELIRQVAQSMAVSLSTHPYYVGKNLDVDEWFK